MNHWLPELNGWQMLWMEAMSRAFWLGTAALALAWLFNGLLLRRYPRLRSWVWRLAFLKMLVAFIWSAPVPLPVLPPVILAYHAISQSPVNHPLTASIATASGTPTSDTIPSHLPLLTPGTAWMLLWLVGVTGGILRVGRRWQETSCLRRNCKPLEDDRALACCAELAGRANLRRTPQLLIAEEFSSPLVMGVVHPVILLPSALWEDFTGEQQRLILAHELAHIKRQDLLWNWLPTLTRALFFFHPLLWIACREERLAQECACDELALELTGSAPAAYGHVLLQVARSVSEVRIPLLAANILEPVSSLTRRVTMMKTLVPLTRRGSIAAGICLCGLIIGGVIPWRLTAGSRPLPPLAVRRAQAQADHAKAVSQWLGMRPAWVHRVGQLRDLWRYNALERQSVLKALIHAQPTDYDALKRAYAALSLPIRGHVPGLNLVDLNSPNPQFSAEIAFAPHVIWALQPGPAEQAGGSKELTKARHEKRQIASGLIQQFQQMRDIEISRSVNIGIGYVTLWASGRVTESIYRSQYIPGKPVLLPAIPVEIMPPYDFLR